MSTGRRCAGAVIAAAIVALIGASPARADGTSTPWAVSVPEDAQATARELHRVGNSLFEQSQFRDALEVYMLALESWDHPAIRYNVAECMLVLGDEAGAYENVTRALAYGPDPLGEDLYRRALAYRQQLEGQVARLDVRCHQTGVTITIDSSIRQPCDGVAATLVSPGEHRIVATLDEHHPLTHTAIAVAGEVTVVHLNTLVTDRPRVVDAMPLADIERSPTLPRGVKAIKMRTGASRRTEGDDPLITMLPLPVYIEWAPSSIVTIEYILFIPHLITLSLYDGDTSKLFVKAGFDLIGLEGETDLSMRADAEAFYRHRVSHSVALTAGFGAHYTVIDESERAAVGPSVGALLQLTGSISASAALRVDYGRTTGEAEPVEIDPPVPQDTTTTEISTPFDLSVAWNANRNWRLRLTYINETRGYADPLHSLELGIARYW